MTPEATFRKTLIWLSLYSIAMGCLETAVVIYMRELGYPDGFDFPLAVMDNSLTITEILRETATLVMLLSVGYLGGRNFAERFAWFIYCFAVWDIFYYVFLNLLIGWPESLLTWDILFLIPVAWTGPVLSPVIVSCTMILLALIILHFSVRKEREVRIRPVEWTWLITGSVVMIVAFIWDFGRFVRQSAADVTISLNMLHDSLLFAYIPQKFNWMLFAVAELILLAGIGMILRRLRRAPEEARV